MDRLTVIAILFLAAFLEAGGDAVVRIALRGHTGLGRGLLLVSGAVVLLAYAVAVNAPEWDFGRLLGIYVVFFFVLAQVISTVVFHQPPDRSVLIGGILVVAGGLVMAR